MKQYAFIQLIQFLQRMFPEQFEELKCISEDWHEETFPSDDGFPEMDYIPITRREFMHLPLEVRRQVMARQAGALVGSYEGHEENE